MLLDPQGLQAPLVIQALRDRLELQVSPVQQELAAAQEQRALQGPLAPRVLQDQPELPAPLDRQVLRA